MPFKQRFGKTNDYIRAMVLPLIIFIGFVLFFTIGVSQTQTAATKENLAFLEKAVLRATVQCYAIEGMYPPNIDYLEKNYGILVDHKKYIVHYEVFASNILPDVRVLAMDGSGGESVE